jgi:hypothetical protein
VWHAPIVSSLKSRLCSINLTISLIRKAGRPNDRPQLLCYEYFDSKYHGMNTLRKMRGGGAPIAEYFRASYSGSCPAYSRAWQAPGSAFCESRGAESLHRQIRDPQRHRDSQSARGILQSSPDEPRRDFQRRPVSVCRRYPPRLPAPSLRSQRWARHSSRRCEYAWRPSRNTPHRKPCA